MGCVEAVTKQFVQAAPGERQLFGALLVRSRTASSEGCLPPHHPLPLPPINSLLQQDSGQASLQRQGGRVPVSAFVALKGSSCSLKCFYCFF